MKTTRVQSSKFKVQSATAWTRRTPLYAFLAACLMFAVVGAHAAEAEQSRPGCLAWQSAQEGIDLRNKAKRIAGDRMAGLNFCVMYDAESGWPRILQDIAADAGRHDNFSFNFTPWPIAYFGSTPVDLGTVEPLDGYEPEIEECVRNWAGTRLVLRYEDDMFAGSGSPAMEVIVSRLTPAALFRLQSDVRLFGGLKYVGTTFPGTNPNVSGAAKREPKGLVAPQYYAAGRDGEVAIRPLDALAGLSLEGMDSGWLLVWHGKKSFFSGITEADVNWSPFGGPSAIFKNALYQADCPILVLFNQAPISIAGADAENGVEVRFGDPDNAALLMLPLLGEYMPPAEETEKWSQGLPKDIVERCDWWAKHARKFPMDVAETYSYDAEKDVVVVREEFTFLDFRDSGTTAAPVAPMFSTAALEGLPLEFSAPSSDPKHVTGVGSYMVVPGVESYEIRFPGLSKYAIRPEPGQGQAPERLTAALGREVEKIIEAGHLAPWMCMMKSIWSSNYPEATRHLVHANPSETLYHLSEALSFLEPALRQRAIEYMKKERTEYPPETAGIRQGGEGARRESYPLSEEFLQPLKPGQRPPSRSMIDFHHFDNFYVRNKLIPPETLLHLAGYYKAVDGEGLAGAWPGIQAIFSPYLERSDWATGGAYRWPDQYRISQYRPTSPAVPHASDNVYGLGGVTDANNRFSACVGLVRLAQMAADKDVENMAWGLLAKTAAARFAMGKMAGHLYARGVMTLPAKYSDSETAGLAMEKPGDDVRAPHALDEFGMMLTVKSGCYYNGAVGLILMRDAAPELGAFARDFLREETRRYFARFEMNIPHWYFAWVESTVSNESTNSRVNDGYQAFMAHAWALGDSAQWLETHLDVPWHPRGDLLYMQKLVETIRAYAQTEK